jgi:hypothetical protein
LPYCSLGLISIFFFTFALEYDYDGMEDRHFTLWKRLVLATPIAFLFVYQARFEFR